MVALFVLLLVIFLTAFFQFDNLINALNQGLLGPLQAFGITANNEVIRVAFFEIPAPTLRAMLGGGAVFFELMIILLTVFDRILDTVKLVVRPLVTLVPLSAFIYFVYQTFYPIIMDLLPPQAGGSGNPANIASAISTGDFRNSILLTFGFMLLYLIVANILEGRSNREIETLRAELKKCRSRLRNG